MIKYLIHFRSLTLICWYLGGRRGWLGRRGRRGVKEREGEELYTGFHLSVFIMESVLSSLSIWQNAEKDRKNNPSERRGNIMYVSLFFLSDPSAALSMWLRWCYPITSQNRLTGTFIVALVLKKHTNVFVCFSPLTSNLPYFRLLLAISSSI